MISSLASAAEHLVKLLTEVSATLYHAMKAVRHLLLLVFSLLAMIKNFVVFIGKLLVKIFTFKKQTNFEHQRAIESYRDKSTGYFSYRPVQVEWDKLD